MEAFIFSFLLLLSSSASAPGFPSTGTRHWQAQAALPPTALQLSAEEVLSQAAGCQGPSPIHPPYLFPTRFLTCSPLCLLCWQRTALPSSRSSSCQVGPL